MPTPDDPLPPDPWHFPLDEHKKSGNENEPAINWESLIVLVLTGVLVWFVAPYLKGAIDFLLGLIF